MCLENYHVSSNPNIITSIMVTFSAHYLKITNFQFLSTNFVNSMGWCSRQFLLKPSWLDPTFAGDEQTNSNLFLLKLG